MSKVDIILMGCVYLILGIPLVIIASKAPEVEDISQLSFDNQDYKIFLNYPPDSVIATNIAPFQRFLCNSKLQTNSSTSKRCQDLLKNTQMPDFSDNAHKLNSLRVTCLIIGIILCVVGTMKFIQLVPQQKSLKSRTKKLSLKHRKKK